jgi:TRAP-type mannitol/chloroaromatic compound transport system substrate-binding protein
VSANNTEKKANTKTAAGRTVPKARIQSAIEKAGNINIAVAEEIVDPLRATAGLGRLTITVLVAAIMVAIDDVIEVVDVAAVGIETTLNPGMA